MRDVYVNQDFTRVGFYKSVLDQAEIPNFIRNHYANSITEMPVPFLFPTLCVIRDEDYAEAMRLLGEIYYAKTSGEADWKCSKCGEIVPGNFELCWKCGADAAD